MAAYGAWLKKGATPKQAQAKLLALFKNVAVQDKSARDALNTFLSGKGDALLTYENEAIAAQRAKQPVQYIVPKATILIENPIAVLKDSGNKDKANQFIRYLKTPAAQQVFADFGYRPVVKRVLEANRSKFPKRPDIFTIDNLGLGGWDKVQKTFFDAKTGIMAGIEQKVGGVTG
jgi:sulfate transport system substrate-binding protein